MATTDLRQTGPADGAGEAALLLQLLRGCTGGATSSVPVELAAEVLASMRFTLELGRVGTDSPLDTEAAYARGLAALERRVRETRRLWLLHRKALPRHASRAWRDSVAGVGEFLRLYQPKYAAHEIPGYFDYPTAVPMPDERGVNWVRLYLTRLCLEADLLARFPERSVAGLTRRFARSCDLAFGDSLENLFALAADHALVLLLSGGDPLTLAPRPDTAALAAARLRKEPDSLPRCAEALIEKLAPGPQLTAYLRAYIALLANRLGRSGPGPPATHRRPPGGGVRPGPGGPHGRHGPAPATG